jgi:IrrE N-terminal-like domain
VTEEEINYKFFYTDWFDPGDRPKTAIAMLNLIRILDEDEVFDELDVTVFAPSPEIFGQLHPGRLCSKFFIYLSPVLEEQTQEQVNFTVAHEFAHACLSHEQYVLNPGTIEKDADALVAKWGFVIPERRKCVTETTSGGEATK